MSSNTDYTISKFVAHAYSEVAYYHQLFDELGIDAFSINSLEDMQTIPLLTRGIVQREEGLFIAKRYQKFPWNSKLIINRSFGPTGQPLRVYWDSDDENSVNETLWKLRKKRYGVDPSMRGCSFYGALYEGNKLAAYKNQYLYNNGSHIAFSISNLTDDRLMSCFKTMTELDITCLYLKPSIAVLLAEAVRKHKLPIPPNLGYIELSGEVLHEEHRKLIQEVFNINPANLYKTGTTGAIAYECSHKVLHVLEHNIVEVIKDGKPVVCETGAIHVTSLANYAMPLIRLDTGDTGILTEAQCSCGLKTTEIQLHKARPCEHFISRTGKKTSGSELTSIVEHSNEHMSRAIQKFQITENSVDDFTIELTLKPAYENWQKAVEREIVINAKEHGMDQTSWSFIYTKEES